MRVKKGMTIVIGAAMMLQAGLASAGPVAARTPSAAPFSNGAPSTAAPAAGMASNRAALGLPVQAASTPCAPSPSTVRIGCAIGEEGSQAVRASGLIVLLAAVAAIGLGIAAVKNADTKPNSP